MSDLRANARLQASIEADRVPCTCGWNNGQHEDHCSRDQAWWAAYDAAIDAERDAEEAANKAAETRANARSLIECLGETLRLLSEATLSLPTEGGLHLDRVREALAEAQKHARAERDSWKRVLRSAS